MSLPVKKEFKEFIEIGEKNKIFNKKALKSLKKFNKSIKWLNDESALTLFESIWLFYDDFIDIHSEELNDQYDKALMNLSDTDAAKIENMVQQMIDSGAAVYASDGTDSVAVNSGAAFTDIVNKLFGNRKTNTENSELKWIKRPPFIINFNKDSIIMNESFSDYIYDVLEEDELAKNNEINPYSENIPVQIDEYNLVFSEYGNDSLALQLIQGATNLQKFSFYPDNNGTAHLDSGHVKYFHKSTKNKFVNTIYKFESSPKLRSYVGTKIFPITVDLTGGNKDVK